MVGDFSSKRRELQLTARGAGRTATASLRIRPRKATGRHRLQKHPYHDAERAAPPKD